MVAGASETWRSAGDSAGLPFCSIIIPCRNEEAFIGRCLDSIIATTHPRDKIEVFIVDGMSDDGTRAIVQAYSAQYPFVTLLDNPQRVTPAALNIGVRAAKGSVIIRMDAHAEYAADYVSLCIQYLLTSGADNVGGIMQTVPTRDTLIGRAIARVLAHPLGVGNSTFRIGARRPTWTDTVFGGCYRRDVFDRIGLWNERLVRGQDMEFNRRLERGGGRTLLVPEIVSRYYAPSELVAFIVHSFRNGVWAIVPFKYSTLMPVRSRHLIPGLFVIALVAAGVLSVAAPVPWALPAVIGMYGLATVAASCIVAARQRDLRYTLVLPVVFAVLHLAYGVGSLCGLAALSVRADATPSPRSLA